MTTQTDKELAERLYWWFAEPRNYWCVVMPMWAVICAGAALWIL